jgi:hypothetical protein
MRIREERPTNRELYERSVSRGRERLVPQTVIDKFNEIKRGSARLMKLEKKFTENEGVMMRSMIMSVFWPESEEELNRKERAKLNKLMEAKKAKSRRARMENITGTRKLVEKFAIRYFRQEPFAMNTRNYKSNKPTDLKDIKENVGWVDYTVKNLVGPQVRTRLSRTQKNKRKKKRWRFLRLSSR